MWSFLSILQLIFIITMKTFICYIPFNLKNCTCWAQVFQLLEIVSCTNSYRMLVYLFFYIRNWTHDLMPARQVLCHWAIYLAECWFSPCKKYYLGCSLKNSCYKYTYAMSGYSMWGISLALWGYGREQIRALLTWNFIYFYFGSFFCCLLYSTHNPWTQQSCLNLSSPTGMHHHACSHMEF